MKTITITFPKKSLTAQQIMKSCDNTIDSGKLLWNTVWYKNEKFFTTEKTRQGTYEIDCEITHRNETFEEAKSNIVKGNEILSFTDYLYIITKSAEFRNMLKGYNYIWTSSKTDAGNVSCVGNFNEDGLHVGHWYGLRVDHVGVGASRIYLNPQSLVPSESLNLSLESAIKIVKKAGYKIYEEI